MLNSLGPRALGFPTHWTRCKLSAALFPAVCAAFCAARLVAPAQTPVLTQHNDIGRTGQNTTETILTTSNVNAYQFGKLFALPVDGQVYAQPLYVPNVTINGVSHNLLIVATENDSVYGFDADSNTGANASPLWRASLVDSLHGAGPGETALNAATTIRCGDLQPRIGISATPVIDPVSQTIYVEAKSTNGSHYFHRLHALNLLTGNEMSPGPVLIAATVNGSGQGSVNGQLVFNSPTIALHQQARSGLLLDNGIIYIAFGSHCDVAPFHGWLFAYNENTLTQQSVYVTTPNGSEGGLWMSGAGIASDATGNIFIASGNGDFLQSGSTAVETGDTILKLSLTNSGLSILDYFTPQDQANLDTGDDDLGSGGVLLLPDQPGAIPHLLVQGGKEGRIFVVNRDQMTTDNTHYCSSGCNGSDTEIVEESAEHAVGGLWNMPAYWNNSLYFWGSGDLLKSIPIVNGLPKFSSITNNWDVFAFPGATPSISSNGNTAGTAIVWAIDSSRYGTGGAAAGPAIIHAYDATNITHELWYSAQAPNNRDHAGNAIKFAVPTISNGKVYVGTATEVDVYGLLNGGAPITPMPVISPSSESVTSPPQLTITDSDPNAEIYYTTDGTTPSPTNGLLYTSAFTVSSSQTVQAVAIDPGEASSEVVSELYTIESNPISTVNYASGMSEQNLTVAGSTTLAGTRLRLTNGRGSQAGSAFISTPVNVQSFTTDFSFQLSNAGGDGFTFTIHGGASPAALGAYGANLGYRPNPLTSSSEMSTSVAIKFDLFNNAGEGYDSTGIYTDAASPTKPAVDMSSSPINLHSGDTFEVHMTYDGATVAMTIKDMMTQGTFSTTFQNVNIPAIVGSSTAYVGFTAGTGGKTAVQDILGWTYVAP